MLVIDFLIYASALLLVILLVYLIISFFPNAKRRIKVFEKKTPVYEKFAFYVSNLVSIVSLILALRTYNDAIKASISQNKVNDSTRIALEKVVKLIASQTVTLDSSRSSLQNVVGLTRTQQKILDATLNVSKEQYKNIKQRNDQDQIQASYRPDIDVELTVDGVTHTTKELVKDHGKDFLYLYFDKSYLNKKVSATIRLLNRGKIPAKGVVTLLTPLIDNSIVIEKISGINPPFDHFNSELNVDIAEFYDYQQQEIPVVNNLGSTFAPVYKFDLVLTNYNSATKIDVVPSNGKTKAFILFINIKHN